MTATRRLLTLLLLAALLAPQGLRASGSGCAPRMSGLSAATAPADEHPDSSPPDPCRSHHSGDDSLPRGTQHCTISLDCASGPALAYTPLQHRDQTAAVPVNPILVTPPPTDSPEPQAPPPRS
jgi:hypothetical protein